mmetsp:Transcript_21727/g.49487  ORF Transcript_21727/g.49487 Transcript_21727/m.49487 type:complete len:205 (-) Transcript_21727:1445-2059(-)
MCTQVDGIQVAHPPVLGLGEVKLLLDSVLLLMSLTVLRDLLVVECMSVIVVSLQTLILDVAVEQPSEDEGSEDGGVQQRPDDYGEGVLGQHVARQRHLRDEVRELRAPDHGPTDHPARRAHEGRADHLGQDAGKDAHNGPLPEGRERHQRHDGDGEGHGARKENPDHPGGHALRLLHPDVVGVVGRLQAGEGHPRDEATPEVSA